MSDNGHNYFFNFPKDMPWKKENKMTMLLEKLQQDIYDKEGGWRLPTEDEIIRRCAEIVEEETGLTSEIAQTLLEVLELSSLVAIEPYKPALLKFIYLLEKE